MGCASAGQVVGRASGWSASRSQRVVSEASRNHLRGPARASQAALWERYRSAADLEARALLAQQYIPLVYSVARQLSVRLTTVEFDELVSAGNLRLLRALEAFDLSRGLAFTTYAVPRIRGAILDDLRQRDWMPRSARARTRRLMAARAELAARHHRAPTPAEVAESLGVDLTVYAELRAAIGRLPGRERRVLALCYFEELTVKQAGEVLGVTESRVYQIRQRAVRRLKEGLTASPRD